MRTALDASSVIDNIETAIDAMKAAFDLASSYVRGEPVFALENALEDAQTTLREFETVAVQCVERIQR